MAEIILLALTAHEEAELDELGRELYYEGNYNQQKIDRFDKLQRRKDAYEEQIKLEKQ